MLAPDQSFFVYERATGRVLYTVDHPTPEGIQDAWLERGEVWVIAPATKNISAIYVSLSRAEVFSEIIAPLYKKREERRAELLQLTAQAETLLAKVLPYKGYEEQSVPDDVLAAAQTLGTVQESISNLTAETADLSAAIDTHTYENGSPVIDRPKLDLPTDYDVQHGGEEVSFALPAGTVWAFRVEGQDAGTHTDEFSMSAAEIGEYLVQAVCWPYEDFQAIIRAH